MTPDEPEQPSVEPGDRYHELVVLTEAIYRERFEAEVKRTADERGGIAGYARFRSAVRRCEQLAEELLADLER